MDSERQKVWLVAQLFRKGPPFVLHGVYSTEGAAVAVMEGLSEPWVERQIRVYHDGSVQLSDGGWESTIWLQPEYVNGQ
jgi:hypothetical protein